MDEKHNLLLKSGDQDQSRWWDTRIKISIFALLYGCANQIRSTTETQFVYAYLKNNTDNNNTYLNSGLNKTTKEDQNCIVNSTGGTDDYIQGLASDWTWYIELITYGFALLVLIVLGPLSDQIGRKPVLVYNLLFTAISFGARAYVIYADLGLYWYLSLSAIEGMAGGHYMFNLACCAMLSNCTKADGERPFMLAIYDAMLGIGMSCSQIAAGYLINLFGFTYPYLISTGLICIICLLLLCTLQETKKEKQDIKTSSFATGIFTFCTQSSALNKDKRKYLFIYFVIFALHLFPIAANSAIKILFTLGSPFCWSSVHIGWYSAGASFGELVIGTFILRLLLVCLGVEIIAVLGNFSAVVSFVLFGLSTSGWMIYEATAVGIIRIVPIPLLKAMASRMVLPDKQGALFANIYLVEAVCRLGGATVFNNIYHQTRPIYKGMVFFVMASFPLCAAILMIYITCKGFPEEQHIVSTVDTPTIQENNTTKDTSSEG